MLVKLLGKDDKVKSVNACQRHQIGRTTVATLYDQSVFEFSQAFEPYFFLGGNIPT